MRRLEVIQRHLVPSPKPEDSISVVDTAAQTSDPVVIVSYCRTPIGGFQGSLASLTAPKLGAVAIKEAVKRAGITAAQVEEVYFGNVVSANVGQAPARQAAKAAGLPDSTICTTVNKVCASGMKAVVLAAQDILLDQASIIVAGGSESMSNAPYYLPKARGGFRLGNGEVVDGLIRDGLWDPYNDHHMGICGEKCATKYNVSRKEQDEYAASSYSRAVEAYKTGSFKKEIVPVEIPGVRGQPSTIVSEDEEYKNGNLDKLAKLRPAFDPKGTVTAGNSSPISDGAAALVLMRESKARQLGLPVIARIRSYADAEQEPVLFTTTPSLAIPKALSKAGLTVKDVDFFEINEAFSVVAIVNRQLLGIDQNKLNVNGGAVSLGHPLGCSGARIICALLSVLEQRNGKIGCAAICNGGGGATAIVVERV